MKTQFMEPRSFGVNISCCLNPSTVLRMVRRMVSEVEPFDPTPSDGEITKESSSVDT